ncbi:MAG: CheR family methyltransferase [Treponema sp.]|nr:chemotaxis protein CheW [Spirochaetia bacterium]MDY4903013.1 CheR family methyltransferase [Treponema sp.]
MATIQDKLSILASTTETADSNISSSQLDEEKKKVAAIDYKMVTFSLSGKDYAVDIMKVKEIAKAGRFTYVPNTMPFLLGVYNLRGEIIPIIDLRIFFNIEVPERDDNTLENMLIVTLEEQTFGVVVDAIDKVIGIQKSSIQPPHPLFGDINIKYIYGVVEAEKHLYILLDVDKIFGVRTPEEERLYAENAVNQMKMRQSVAASNVPAAKEEVHAEIPQEAAPEKQNTLDDFKFIADSLANLKKFTLNKITEEWALKRYEQWSSERGNDKTQLQSPEDAELFLKPFYSKCNETWWTEEYANQVEKVLPENSAKTIVVWNPGCGKGYESYSLACILKKKYPDAKIRIYGHDVDLLSVSNAPLMTLTEQASNDWYQPFTTRTVSGDYTFTKEIKDMIMFEYHDCVNTNNLPPIDIIFARDLLSFLPETSQNSVLGEFSEKMKGNGVIIVGDNENISIPGWNKKADCNISVYSK